MTGIMFARVHARAIRAFARASTFAKSMRGMAAPCLLSLALAAGLAPATSFADDAQDGSASASDAQAESVAGPLAGPGYEGDAQSASPNSDLSSAAEGLTLASALSGTATSIVSADVALDAAEPVVGSFTADGLTYAVGPDGLTLVSADADAASDGAIAVPASVAYDGVAYDVIAVGPYAFYLSGATAVELPASVASVDSRALRSSDVASVQVAEDNPAYATCNGVLYDAGLASLLLIPEGRSEGVRIPYTAEEVPAEAFSHAAEVSAIFVDADSPTYSSEDGLLYSADSATLLRVPAGATEITIRDGCTTIAAGAMEGCAKLERINAPATVASISPDVFTSVPTVSLPAASVSGSSTGAEGEAEVSPRRVVAESQGLSAPLALPDLGSTSASSSPEAATQPSSQDEENLGVASSLLDQANAPTDSAPQLTAMVALSSADDDLPEVDPASIEVRLPESADRAPWEGAGFAVSDQPTSEPMADVEDAAAYGAASYWTVAPNYPGRGYVMATSTNISGVTTGTQLSSRPIMTGAGTVTVKGTSSGGWSWTLDDSSQYANGVARAYPGYTYKGWSTSPTGTPQSTFSRTYSGGTVNQYAIFDPNPYTIALDANAPDALVAPASISTTYDAQTTLPVPVRPAYRFTGWNTAVDGSGASYGATATKLTTTSGATVTLYAQWEPYEINFDTDSEPDDADYPGVDKDPVSAPDAVGPDGTIAIEDPKRPGYVFEGWVIPTEDGTEAIDQDLVYQDETDGKWYVDASKLPDYAGDDGRVELTARWTSVISVDVPSSVTFYADLVTQGQESREGAASSAFGQSKVSNQSQVDLRVVGLESSAVKADGSTLGADSILKKAEAATPATSTQKLLSLYPSTKAWTAEELQDPDAVGGDKPASVDFDLDDILLEKSFTSGDLPADAFTIAAGDTLNIGYRLNLTESGQQLDYDKLSTLSEGQSAAIANVSYCFAADALPSDWGEPLWIENPERSSNPAKYLLLKDIKEAADDLSANGTSSEYYATYKALLDAQVTDSGNPGTGPYFQLKVDGVYLPLQLIGICQDTKSDGTGKAGLTFQTRDIYAYGNKASTVAGGDTFTTYMNPSITNSGGWSSSAMCNILHSTFWDTLPLETQAAIVGVDKFHQLYGGTGGSYLQKTANETIWLPSMREVFGTSFSLYNDSEALTTVAGYVPFQYMAYQPGGTSNINARAIKTYNGLAHFWWLRSAYRNNNGRFCTVIAGGNRSYADASDTYGVAPCFCL